ncbi:glutamate--tRNA ligase family protein [Pseudoflavitalea rhizosphaerae]|uniref:glutamate--tRNA ligase family protein n=1 Tax=Pseudoflavitalea rhizosphaerae TaxID=1884793 RepID=UPI000F8CEF7B|nr:glutamate--tRNA ligase family protein [Pseudoflavitalea rhizosphaerae]
MSQARSFNKTRIAPTPSGYLHLGNAFSFILTTALARKNGASILLRIDDMDQARAQDEYIQDIFDLLEFLELPWDEGPRSLREFKEKFSQIHRLPIYQEMLQQLVTQGMIFACNCTRSQLQQSAPDGNYPGTCIPAAYPLNSPDLNWRLFTDSQTSFPLHCMETNSITVSLPQNMNHFVVRKKDGMPSYQLASVADDIYFGIDLIVRGLDLRPSSIAQRYLSNQLAPNSFQEAVFFHHQLLNDEKGEKLSKSAGSTSIQYLRKNGKKKEDIYRLLAKLTGLPEKEVHNWQSFGEAFFANER